MTKANGGISIASIKAQVSNEDRPVDFEPLDKDDKPSGVFLKVISDQASRVRDGIARIEKERRKSAALLSVQAAKSRPGEVVPDFDEDVERLIATAALNIVGWRGPGETDGLSPEQAKRFTPLTDPYTEENAVELLRWVPSFAAQINKRGAELAGFTGTSAKTS